MKTRTARRIRRSVILATGDVAKIEQRVFGMGYWRYHPQHFAQVEQRLRTLERTEIAWEDEPQDWVRREARRRRLLSLARRTMRSLNERQNIPLLAVA